VSVRSTWHAVATHTAAALRGGSVALQQACGKPETRAGPLLREQPRDGRQELGVLAIGESGGRQLDVDVRNDASPVKYALLGVGVAYLHPGEGEGEVARDLDAGDVAIGAGALSVIAVKRRSRPPQPSQQSRAWRTCRVAGPPRRRHRGRSLAVGRSVALPRTAHRSTLSCGATGPLGRARGARLARASRVADGRCRGSRGCQWPWRRSQARRAHPEQGRAGAARVTAPSGAGANRIPVSTEWHRLSHDAPRALALGLHRRVGPRRGARRERQRSGVGPLESPWPAGIRGTDARAVIMPLNKQAPQSPPWASTRTPPRRVHERARRFRFLGHSGEH
jgi:hypothetical protein